MANAQARERGRRRDGSMRWEGRFCYPDPANPRKRVWKAKGGFRRKGDAERWARAEEEKVLSGATLSRDRRTRGIDFAQAADEWLRYVEHDRGVKPSTMSDYRSTIEHHLKPAFGSERIEEITTARIEQWKGTLVASRSKRVGGRPLAARTRHKIITILYGVFERARKVWGLPLNPVADVELPRTKRSGDLEVFSPEEVWSLVRAAKTDQDGALYLTAAFTGLRRGELLALRWRDVDFTASTIRVRASYAAGSETLPKSGKVRAVPMVDEVASTLARLGGSGDDALVFGKADGGYLDASALRRRYDRALKAAGLRPLRFHDLRHTFGSLAINRASIVQVAAWMGHADIATTQKYLHYKHRGDEAALLAGAFSASEPVGPTSDLECVGKPQS